MDLQSSISYDLNQKRIAKTYKVLFDRKEGDYYIGRTEFDSPDVDNEVIVNAKDFYLKIGDFADIKITNARSLRPLWRSCKLKFFLFLLI